MKTRYYISDFIGTILVVAGLAKLWAKDGVIPDYIPLDYDGLSLLLVALCFFVPSTIILFRKGIKMDRERKQKPTSQETGDS